MEKLFITLRGNCSLQSNTKPGFYKKYFYKQRQTEIGKKLGKS